MEMTEARLREIVREEVSQMREEWAREHTWDKFEDHLEDIGYLEWRKESLRALAEPLEKVLDELLDKQIDARIDARLGNSD